MWSSLMNIACNLEKNVYSAVLGEKFYKCRLYPIGSKFLKINIIYAFCRMKENNACPIDATKAFGNI